ncbi:ADP-ribose pyrophosphatase YjhB (NUDIX family) [Nocardiopsis mwathae]|uniref:ADP-ribose pyrophosphatase YjhB (NUDIX family) n=1 Tax=Nocardiopsis mwathae TaxID=1472723 RepID=A0A7W9YHA3_9ACTN|nr:NUDIX hydrolase [Nocardiopsis mwathae]MBB6172133.1 ADP-ribose pyrophosphatase YjhB (NUDIX family) [Nocardiopsis mwathae]
MDTRVTGLLVEDGQVLLLDQDTDGPRRWSLPGGRVEEGETLGGALVREMREETGIDVEVGRLLYVCDHIVPEKGLHVIHMTFEVRRVGGALGEIAEGIDTRPIRGVEFVKTGDLPQLGFSERFAELVKNGFPGAGSYMGPKSAIGL